MPEEINVMDTVENTGKGIGKFILGTIILLSATACVFAFGPKHLPKKDQDYAPVPDKPETTADDKAQEVETN